MPQAPGSAVHAGRLGPRAPAPRECPNRSCPGDIHEVTQLTLPWTASPASLGPATRDQRPDSVLPSAWAALTTPFRWFLRVVVWSSVWAAASIASLSLFAQHALGLEVDWLAPAAIFASALFIYNLDHIVDSRVQQIDDCEARSYFRHPALVLLTGLAGVATAGLLWLAPPAAQLVFVGYATIGVLYGLPLVPDPRSGAGRWWRLKDLPMSKGLLVGTAVSWGTVGMAVACSGASLDHELLAAAVFTGAFTFVFVTSNTHVSDIPDLASDLRAGVRTLPATLGIRHTRRTLVAVNLAMMALMMWGWGADTTSHHAEMVVSLCASVLYILSVDTRTPREVYGVLVDGSLVLPALLVSLRGALA